MLSTEIRAVFLPVGKNFPNEPPFFLPVGNPEWRAADIQLPWRPLTAVGAVGKRNSRKRSFRKSIRAS